MKPKYYYFFLLLILAALLSSCSTTSRKDGPPPFDVDESKIPNAVPCHENLSKSGNKSYCVFGKRYHVLRTAKNYDEVGVASWYGSKFHSHYTSNGERYNMLAMTAAHKSLPLPTYVQVTNLKNGRQVIVKVNDRGPFEANRIIDLSYVAAKKLGMLGHGTAHVRVRTITPEDLAYPVEFAANKPRGREVYLQVGAFQSRNYAEKLKRKLSPIVTSPILITRLDHKSKTLYHVKIGPIRDVATADHINRKLQSVGVKSKEVS